MSTFYFDKNDTLDKNLNKDLLLNEISEIIPSIRNISVFETNFVVIFEGDLNASQIEILSNKISSHKSMTTQQRLAKIIKEASEFGQNLILEFAAENMLMGITQAGKTKQVADYLTDVIRYVQTGSLYEVVNEIDRLKNSGIPENLSPYITEERMEIFKNRILGYLNG